MITITVQQQIIFGKEAKLQTITKSFAEKVNKKQVAE